jgi:LPS export ABC transporter protein LptC
MTHRLTSRLRPAVVAALAAATAVATACKDQPPTLPSRMTLPDSAEQVMFGLRHALTVNGVRRGELMADTALFYDAMNRVEMRGVTTYFFTATGDSTAVMTGREGTYDVRQQRVEGRGDVKIVAKDGRQLTSPRLVYDRTNNQVSSDTSFTFKQPGREISGIGFRSDPDLRNVQVLNAARGSSVIGRGGRR